jgi:hypothetical protein
VMPNQIVQRMTCFCNFLRVRRSDGMTFTSAQFLSCALRVEGARKPF